MILEKIEVYDGSYLRKRFAYDHFLDKTQAIGNIIAFQSPIKIGVENLVDKDKIINNETLYSQDAINFCMELPNISLFSGVCFQRIFNSGLGNILASNYLKCDVEIDGPNIIVHKEQEEEGIIRTHGIASITDVSQVDGAVLIHTGIHIKSGQKAARSAFSTGLNEHESIIFMREGIEFFYGVLHEMFVETTKKVS